MTRDDNRKKLQDDINETLDRYQNEESTTADGFNIIRWARRGYLKGDVR